MKKIIVVLFLFMLSYLIFKEKEVYIIPDSAIRFRVIANSNTFKDQAMKMEIKNNIENILKENILSVSNKEEAVNIIAEKIPDIKKMINTYENPFTINYGKNYFPEKTYKGVKYQEGEYESLVVTLGEGKGDNWWCVLFPPLCLAETNEDTNKDVEYSFFVKEMFNKYM